MDPSLNIIRSVIDAYNLYEGIERDNAINAQLNHPESRRLLDAWLKAHPKIADSSPLFSDLQNRLIKPISVTSKLFNLPFSLVQTAIHYIRSANKDRLDAAEIEQALISLNLVELKKYFSKYPEDIFTYADLIKTHVDLSTISPSILILILRYAADNLHDREEPVGYYPFIETIKSASLYRIFQGQLKNRIAFDENIRYLADVMIALY